MLACGIVDPAKVTRSALENAASVSGMVLTTESWWPISPSLPHLLPHPTWAAWAACIKRVKKLTLLGELF